jgi:hypothetical protein
MRLFGADPNNEFNQLIEFIINLSTLFIAPF